MASAAVVPRFTRLMARLEREKLVEGWYEQVAAPASLFDCGCLELTSRCLE